MPGPKATAVSLTDAEAERLRSITRRQTAPQNLVRRARMILLMHQGLGNTEIARKTDCARSLAEAWRKRWIDGAPARRALDDHPEALQELLEAQLSDAPRSGAPVSFSAEQVTQIIALSLRPPEDFGYPVTHWTPTELAQEAIKQGIVETISPRTVGRFLKRGRPETAPEPLLAQSAFG